MLRNKYIPTLKSIWSVTLLPLLQNSHPRLGSASTDSLGLPILKTWGEGPMETSTVVARSEHKDEARGLMQSVADLAKPIQAISVLLLSI